MSLLIEVLETNTFPHRQKRAILAYFLLMLTLTYFTQNSLLNKCSA